jgi:hypothetical protein
MKKVFIYTSGYRDKYFESIRRALSLPTGTVQRFIYDEKYISPNILKNPDSYIGKDAIIFYTQKQDNMETTIPIREVKIHNIYYRDDVVVIEFIHSDKYWKPGKNADDIMRECTLIKQRVKHFVFEAEVPEKLEFTTERKDLFRFVVEDDQIMKANGQKIDLLYSIDIVGNNVTFDDGLVTLQKNKAVKITIYFYSKTIRQQTRGFKVYSNLGKIEFPIDFDENDLRTGIMFFLAYPVEVGYDAIVVDVDGAYRTEFIVKISDKLTDNQKQTPNEIVK